MPRKSPPNVIALTLKEAPDDVLAYVYQGNGVFTIVEYPYRKTRDLYCVMKGPHNVFCAQCAQEIPKTKLRTRASQDRFTAHVISHHRRKGLAKRLAEIEAVKIYEHDYAPVD